MPLVSLALASTLAVLVPSGSPEQSQAQVAAPKVTCTSTPGQRSHCPADTSHGVILVRSTGQAACLLGKTWGYDDKGIWVSDGCSAEFVAGKLEGAQTKQGAPQNVPNAGFLLFDGDKGQIYFRL